MMLVIASEVADGGIETWKRLKWQRSMQNLAMGAALIKHFAKWLWQSTAKVLASALAHRLSTEVHHYSTSITSFPIAKR